MSKNVKILIFFILFLICSVILKIGYDNKENNALKKSVIVVANVSSIEPTRNYTVVNIKYLYNSKVLNGFFTTSNNDLLDSLKKCPPILIRVSKLDPVNYLQFIKINQ
jgi:hypothetical protein